MNQILKFSKVIVVFCILINSFGCDEYFEFSPYAANVKDSYKDTHERNLDYLVVRDSAYKDVFKFAVFADSHYNYHELDEAIVNMNNRSDIDFVIADGDIADHGYLKEYELFHDQMENLHVPYFAVIGNHGYRSNGGKVFRKMYGNPNRSFTYNNNLFILFDDVFWESNKTPDFNWLENELINSDKYENVFVICHIPPYDEQYTAECENIYRKLMEQNNVDLSIHGHMHRFEYVDYYGDGVKYLVVEPIIYKEYSIVTVKPDEITVESIKY